MVTGTPDPHGPMPGVEALLPATMLELLPPPISTVTVLPGGTVFPLTPTGWELPEPLGLVVPGEAPMLVVVVDEVVVVDDVVVEVEVVVVPLLYWA